MQEVFDNTSSVRYFSLGRHALVEALRLLGLAHGQKILVPEFLCRDLLASLHTVGAKPVFYPVVPSLSPRSLPESPQVAAVLAVDYFGFPQSLEPFQTYCRKTGAVLIEDNAHGFLSRDAEGHLLGTRGDLGIFSLRKTFPLPDGAALIANRAEWQKRLPSVLPCREEKLPKSFRVKSILRSIQNATGLRVRTSGESMARFLRRIRTGQALPIPSPDAELEIPGDPAIHRESLRLLEGVDTAREVERRRELYLDFRKILGDFQIEPIFGELPKHTAPYGYPFRATKDTAEKVGRLARRKGFDCASWPDLPEAVLGTAPDYYRNVWWINFL